MRILVTGGSGFVGARVVARLVADGHDALTLARSEAAAARLRTLGATPVPGDLARPSSIALPRVDAVIHAAALFRLAGPRAPFFRINVDGTRALLAAAEAAGAASFIHLGAAAVIMDDRGSPVRGADEHAPTVPDSALPYIASKAQAEAAVLAADRPGFRTLSIRPPAIWGPGDAFSRAIPRAIASGRFAFIDRGDYPYDTCHVDTVVEALVSALVRGAGGRAYFIRDPDTVTFRGFVAGLAATQGLSVEGLRSMPYGLAFNLGRLMEIGARLVRSRHDPPLSRAMVRLIGREFTVDDAAARRELGHVGGVSRDERLAAYAGEAAREPLTRDPPAAVGASASVAAARR